jgi:hypothetical protein
MGADWRVYMYIHVFLTLALVEDELSASQPYRLIHGKHWIGGWLGTRSGLDDVRRKFLVLPELELLPLDRPARSQSLHRLLYPGS